MRLKWDSSKKLIIMTFRNGSVLEWPGAAWSRAGSHITEGLFDPINDWWETRDPALIEQFELNYQRIHDRFNDPIDPATFTKEMQKLMTPLLKPVDWENFKTWCLVKGRLFLTNGEKTNLDEKDHAGITYFTEEYTDLMVFSVILKIVMPVWGAYHKAMDKVIGKDFLHMEAINTIAIPMITKLPPWKKLEDYVQHFADLRIKKDGFTLTKGIGRGEIPDYLFSLALIKKVVIYNVRSRDRSIVTDVYHTLNERCGDVNKPGVTQKLYMDEASEEISVVDQYKIVQRIPPAISAMIEHSLEDMEALIKDIDSTAPFKTVKTIRENLPLGLTVADYHIALTGIVMNDVLGARNLMLVDYTHLLNAIAVSVVILKHKGFDEIAMLLTTQPSKRDMYEINFSDITGRTFTVLDNAIAEELQLIYKYQSQQLNPGILLIESIVKDISRYDWNVDYAPFNDMRNAIGRLLITANNEVFKNKQQ